MAKTRKFKKEILKEYKDKIQTAKALIVLKAKSVTSNESSQFKRTIFAHDSQYHVVKNTIFRIALQEAELGNEDKLTEGEHAVMFMKEDIINPSKALKEFIGNVKDSSGKESKIDIVFGFLDGIYLSKDQVVELAEMPDKQGSIGLILGILDQAMSSVVNVLEDAPRSIATVLDLAFSEK